MTRLLNCLFITCSLLSLLCLFLISEGSDRAVYFVGFILACLIMTRKED